MERMVIMAKWERIRPVLYLLIMSDLAAGEELRPVAKWPLNKYAGWKDISGNGHHLRGKRAKLGPGPGGPYQSYERSVPGRGWSLLEVANFSNPVMFPQSYTYLGYMRAKRGDSFNMFAHVHRSNARRHTHHFDKMYFSAGLITVLIGNTTTQLANITELGVKYWESWTFLAQSYDHKTGDVVLRVNGKKFLHKLPSGLTRKTKKPLSIGRTSKGGYQISCVTIYDDVISDEVIGKCQRECLGFHFRLIQNGILDPSSVSQCLYVNNVDMCLTLCQTDRECKAFNYNESTHQCGLSGAVPRKLSTVTPGVKAWEIEPYSQ